MKRLKNPNYYNHGPDALGHNFWDFIEVDFGFDPKTSFNPCDLVVGLNPPMGVDRQHESREARSLYPSALQLTRALRLEFVGRAT
jgi:hypothetical protein